MGTDAKHLDPAHYQRLSCGWCDSELQGGWIMSSSGTAGSRCPTKPMASLCNRFLVFFIHATFCLYVFFHCLCLCFPWHHQLQTGHPSRNTTGNNWHPCLWSQVTAPPAGWVGKVTGKKNSYPAPVTCLPHCDHGQRRRVLTWPVPPSHTMGTKKGTCFFKEDVVMGEGQSQLHQRSQMPRWPWEVQVQDQFQPPQVSVTVILRLPEGREHTDLQLWSDIDQRE